MPCLLSSVRASILMRPLAVCCCAFLACPVARAEAPSPVELSETTPLEEPILGGAAKVSPALVPTPILSLEEAREKRDDAPAARVAKGNRRAQRRRAEDPGTLQEPPTEPLTPEERSTRDRVRRALQAYEGWRLNSRDHSPWEVMHAIVARGISTQILAGGPNGYPKTAIGWLCYNQPAAGMRLFYLSDNQLGTLQGPGLEGHRGQLLAVLAQARVKPDYPIRIGGRSFTVADLIEHEKRTCYAGTELTFKLIGLNYYLDQDARWESEHGEVWDIARLVREELSQPIRGATCGGTHRLSGLSLAVRKRIDSGLPLDGEYARAARYIREYHAYTFRLQNRDGSLSTEWFGGRGTDPSPARRMQTTGHILEWLCYSLPDSEIRTARPRAAVDYLADLLWRHRNRTWENGPLGHALHSLMLYDERVFQQHDAFDQWQSTALSKNDSGPAASQ